MVDLIPTLGLPRIWKMLAFHCNQCLPSSACKIFWYVTVKRFKMYEIGVG